MFLEVPDWYENHANTIYNDFEFLDPGVGNNGFSMDRRRVRNRLQLTPLRLGSIDDVRIGQHVVFQDFVPDEQGNDVWQECRGLDANILCLDYDIPIYVFDNHNLVFYAWMEAVHLGWIGGGGMRCLSSDFIPMKSDTVSSCGLIHVDAHFDYNQPESVDVKFDSLHDVVKYTHEVLQVSTYIRAAQQLHLFDFVFNFVEEKNFNDSYIASVLNELTNCQLDGFVVNLDLDIFAPEMSHVSFDRVLDVLKSFKSHIRLMTFATSPGFITQERSILYLNKIVSSLF